MKDLSKEMILLLSHISGNQLDDKIAIGAIPLATLTPTPWIFLWEQDKTIWKKLQAVKLTLADVTTHIFQGLKTSADSIYIGDMIKDGGSTITMSFNPDDKECEIESMIMKPLIKGGQMRRYSIGESSKFILFPYDNGILIPSEQMKQQYPKAWAYLSRHKPFLENREDGKMKGKQWYAYGRSQALNIMHLSKIVTPDYYAQASYCLDSDGKFYFCGGGAGGYGIVVKPIINVKYLLALLNSRLLDWYLHKITLRAYQTAYMYVKKYISQLPIRTIDFNNPSEKAIHNKLVSHVDRMLDLHKKKAALPPSAEREKIEREIAVTDEKIDEIVYGIYGIKEQERKIIGNK